MNRESTRVKVTSGLANVNFSVRSISRQGPYLVVRDEDGAGMPTVVYVSAQDIVAALKALLASPAALLLVLTAPFRRKAPGASVPGSNTWHDDLNNPWL
jgi:hypothetical protein